jgi:8-oxo-dGTP pyrophosphatase MutT (NUDIX family)
MTSKTVTTLSMIHDDDRVLLAMKKRGHGVGKWNGYGGKISAGESIEQAMVRELQEESGLLAKKFEKRAIITFDDQGNGNILEMHVFRIFDFEGEPVETEEMAPKWFSLSEIPYSEMWESDRTWLPMYFNDDKIIGDVKVQGWEKIRTENFQKISNL